METNKMTETNKTTETNKIIETNKKEERGCPKSASAFGKGFIERCIPTSFLLASILFLMWAFSIKNLPV